MHSRGLSGTPAHVDMYGSKNSAGGFCAPIRELEKVLLADFGETEKSHMPQSARMRAQIQAKVA